MLQVFIAYNSLQDAIIGVEPAASLLPVLHNLTDPNHGLQVYNLPLDWKHEGNIVFCYAQKEGINIYDCNQYINLVKEHSELLLEYPCGMFVLDIDENVAQQLTRNYGVICQTPHTISISPLIYRRNKYIEKGSSNHSWQDIMGNTGNAVSNSLVVIDRYLFSQTHHKFEGICNFKSILISLLPKELEIPFHITIISQYNEHKDNYFDGLDSFKELAEGVQLVIDSLHCNYEIIVEIFMVNESDKCVRELFHNRRIISNYYFIKSEHGFCSLAQKDNEAFYDDSFAIKFLFSEGLNNDDDVPDRQHSKLLYNTANYLYDIDYKKYEFRYACNGEEYPCTMQPKNRLLNKKHEI